MWRTVSILSLPAVSGLSARTVGIKRRSEYLQIPLTPEQMVAEFGRHEIVGEMEVLTSTERFALRPRHLLIRRATTVLAVRDSELAKVPSHVVQFAKLKHPSVCCGFEPVIILI
jgi:hypothetical protein